MVPYHFSVKCFRIVLVTLLCTLLPPIASDGVGETGALTTRQLVERVSKQVDLQLSGFGLHRKPGKDTFLQVRPSSAETEGHGSYQSAESFELTVPKLKAERIPETNTYHYVDAGDLKTYRDGPQDIHIFISGSWRPPNDEWKTAPARRTFQEKTYSDAIWTKSMEPFPQGGGPESEHETITYKKTVYDQAIEVYGYRGRLKVARFEGQRAEPVTQLPWETRAVSVNRDDGVEGFLMIEEPPHRLGIHVEAGGFESASKTWVPTMQSNDVLRLLEIIAGHVKNELGQPVSAETPGPEPEDAIDDSASEESQVDAAGEITEEETAQSEPDTEPIADVVEIFVQSGHHQQALVRIRAKLRACVVALKEEWELLISIRETLAVTDPDSPHRADREKWASEVEETIRSINQERDELLADALKRWDLLRRDLDEVINGRDDSPAIQRDLMSYRNQLELKQQLSELELLFAAGKSTELRARLPEALQNPALAENAEVLKLGDLLERGKMGEALQTSRLGAQKYPDNLSFAFFQKDLEVAYLKAISSKAVDDGARLRVVWDEYVEGADASLPWQAFFGGLKRTYHRSTGKSAKMEALAKSDFDRAAMEHNGIELMRRLREKGLTLYDIQDLNEESLRGWMMKIAPKRGEPSDETVENFAVALKAAFLNDDVMRLMIPESTPMQLSEGSYYGSEAFETSGLEFALEYALDSVSAKNMLMIFGPVAKLGSIPGNLARLAARFGQGPRVAAAFGDEAAALTIGEWVYSSQPAQSIAAGVAETRAGDVLREAGHVLRELRYHDKTLVRWSTVATGFATQVAGNWLLMEGAGVVGDKLGGEYGRIAGELAAGLVGLPGVGTTARLQERMERAKNLMAQARVKANATEAVLKTLRAPVHEAAETAARQGGRLSAAQRSTLQQAIETLEETAAGSRSAAALLDNSPLVHGGADEAEALVASGQASLAGRTEDALSAGRIARTVQREVEQLGEALDAGQRQIGQAMEETGEQILKPTGRPARAPDSQPSMTGDPLPPRTRIPQIDDPPPDIAPPMPPEPVTPNIAELEEAAEAAMKAENYDEAAALLHTASRHADLNPDAAPRIIEALEEARGAARSSKFWRAQQAIHESSGLANEIDQAMKAFDKEQLKHLQELMEDGKLSDMALIGEGISGARLIEFDGKPLAVWKPGKRDAFGVLEKDGQIAAEILMSRLGKKLGLKIPYAMPMMVEGKLGVAIRWIPATKNLAALSPGARIALKKQIAAFRPLQTMMGNYDIHMDNFKIDRAGRVWAIDAGLSYLHTPQKPNLPTDILDWTRFCRDWCAERGKISPFLQPNSRLRELFTASEMRESAEALRSLPREEIEAAVQEALDRFSAPYSMKHTDEVLETLFVRHENLPALLNEIWEGTLEQAALP